MSLSINLTSNSKYLMVNSWLQLISLLISYENLVLDQDSNLCLISLSIIITSFLDNVWKLQEEITR